MSVLILIGGITAAVGLYYWSAQTPAEATPTSPSCVNGPEVFSAVLSGATLDIPDRPEAGGSPIDFRATSAVVLRGGCPRCDVVQVRDLGPRVMRGRLSQSPCAVARRRHGVGLSTDVSEKPLRNTDLRAPTFAVPADRRQDRRGGDSAGAVIVSSNASGGRTGF